MTAVDQAGCHGLLARDLGMRATIDVDLYRAQTTEMAEADMRQLRRAERLVHSRQ